MTQYLSGIIRDIYFGFCILLYPEKLFALSTSENGWYILASSAGGRFGRHSAAETEKKI